MPIDGGTPTPADADGAGRWATHPAGTGPFWSGLVSSTRCGLIGTNRPALVGAAATGLHQPIASTMMFPPVGTKIEIDPCPSGTIAKFGRISPGAATFVVENAPT